MEGEDILRPLAERRTHRESRQLPKRYRDVFPEPPAALPPPSLHITPDRELTVLQSTSPQSPAPALPVRQVLKSRHNIFGIFRQYYAARFPPHDPAQNIMPNDLNISTDVSSLPLVHDYGPYPNQWMFLLGEWHWNGGERKSQSTFSELIKIIGHPDYRPEYVAGKNWKQIDAVLSGDHCKGSDIDGWKDECDDNRPQGWIKTPIRIKVPFNKRMLRPGQQEYDTGILHHRKLVSVIKEKITRPSMHPHLHFEPYKLFWQPSVSAEPVRVHGELYTSDAFIEAHDKLQDSPPEPGCNLPRVVLGLMFASDGTQLTSFSTAKLWPVYMTIGNESKGRRAKPSSHAFEHIAYLESASEPPSTESHIKLTSLSSLMLLRPLPLRTSARRQILRSRPIVIGKCIKLNGRSSSTTSSSKHTNMAL